MKTIRADIKSRAFRPVYLIYGEEAYLRQSLKRSLRAAVAGEDDMNYLYLEGKDADPLRIIEAAETMPFFADKRLIVVENSGFFKKDAGKLPDFLDTMPDTTCLVFVEEAIDKRNRLYKKVQALGHVAECTRQTTAELTRWVGRGLAQAGKKVTAATVNAFLARTGEDMETIRQELEKLIAYTGDREVVTTEDVEAITTQQVNGRIFEMIDAIATRDRKRALELYYDLLVLKEPPMRIMALVARQFRGILQVKEMKEQGLGKQAIVEKTGFRPFVADRYIRQASRFRYEELEKHAATCVEMDEAVKKGNMTDTLAAEMLILGFTE